MEICNLNGMKLPTDLKTLEELLYIANRKRDAVTAWEIASILEELRVQG